MNFTKYQPHFVLSLLTILISLLVWFGFYYNLPNRLGFPQTSLETIFANYDGPNYMVISKCGYVRNCIATNFSLPQPLEYYPAHFPGFPLLIRYFSLFTSTPKAMLVASLLGSILLTLASYQFFLIYLKSDLAYKITLLSLFFPARLLVLRLIGAPETWFIALTLLSIILFQKRQYLMSALLAALTVIFKSPGILLFAVYFCMFIFDWLKLQNRLSTVTKYLPYLLGPVTVLIIFYFYYLQTGDFFAYFHSGDNIHLNLLPYLVFISNRSWINTIWLEDVIYIYILAYISLSRLFTKFKFNIIFIYPLFYTLATVFVAHRDISRYLSPTYPFFLLAFAQLLSRHHRLTYFYVLLPAIVLFVINFLIGNVAPIADWTPYL